MPDEYGYPTPEEIMAYPVDIDSETITLLRSWHKLLKDNEFPKRINVNMWQFQRYMMLTALLGALAKRWNVALNGVFAGFMRNNSAASLTGVVLLGSPSIITTLHEFAHLLHGNGDETAACAWSVKHFKEAFPAFYEKLEWNGHMLVRRKPVPAATMIPVAAPNTLQ